ncbi:hypothetical protein HU200_015300 [Digitaria exilis]|uniref:Glycosyltransferase n=1 Tax=Digitaria exilis TaxID=1010633 RepID=A0A835FB68_9POAL|nr:hypothetical protein HU200_015300 [Digitaria exilis]CAB3469572.1 unnamed protein product [Digitaria exilis]
MKKTVVLYPGLAVSHFVPMMQLADALLDEGYAVVVALIDATMEHDASFAAAVRRRAASSTPAITFHTLPRIHDPPAITPTDARFLLRYFELVRRYNNGLLELLRSMPPRSIHAVVVDALSNEALNVAKEMGVPAYTFFAWSASALAVFLQLSAAASVRDEGQQVSFKELGDSPLDLLGVPPMPASHLNREMLEDPNGEIYQAWMSSVAKNLEANGMLVNTFVSLEARALVALNDPKFLPGSEFTMPPVYAVGSFVEGPGGERETKQKHDHECLVWLDKQPGHSVVFLCFGSTGWHTEEQLKEIAIGLERSGHRFLWVVRAPVSDSTLALHADPDLDALLPEGFLERTNGHGLVVKEWAPQVDVLRHKAIGAFVTHCGWNSVQEAIMAGVPMLCWPLYAEQKMNKVFMVEEFGVGVEVVGWQQGFVKAEEVEAKVTLVLERQEGERLRARVRALKEAAAMAWNEGGSSRTAFGQFLLDLAA